MVKGVDDRVDVIGYCAVGSNLGYNTVRVESALPLLNMLNHINSNRLEQLNRYINMKLCKYNTYDGLVRVRIAGIGSSSRLDVVPRSSGPSSFTTVAGIRSAVNKLLFTVQ